MHNIRTGLGIDFHKLIHEPNRPLRIGGYEIPGNLALVGHSDADILLHSLCDAILGALGESDIGEFFSDRDPKNKNLDSTKILAAALARLKAASYQISNIDITLIGEKPFLNPHKPLICASVAKLVSLGEDRISIKASTTEKMGALGREEGLACLTNIIIYKNDD